MANKKQDAPKESKPYDSLVKALFGEQSEEVISSLIAEVRSAFYPIIICMWEKDPYQVVEGHQRCLYPFLPAMKEPTVELLTQAVREMDEHDSRPQFRHHLAWFQTMLGRTTTISKEDKQKIREVLKMQYQGYALFREDPVIGGMILEGELKGKIEGEIKGKIEGLQEAILGIVGACFPTQVVAQVQQAIAPIQDMEQLRTFLRQLALMSEEQEVYALLTPYLSLQDKMKSRIEGEIEGVQESILDIVSDRFSSEIVDQVQQTIAPVQDVQQLRKLLRQLARTSDEEEIPALLTQCFPSS